MRRSADFDNRPESDAGFPQPRRGPAREMHELSCRDHTRGASRCGWQEAAFAGGETNDFSYNITKDPVDLTQIYIRRFCISAPTTRA